MAYPDSTPALTAERERSEYPEFSAPKGFVPPEGTEPGKPFPVVAELQVKPDGTLCLVSIEGAEFEKEDGYEEEEEVEVEDDGLGDETVTENVVTEQDPRGFAERLASL